MKIHTYYNSVLHENGDELCNIEGHTIGSLRKQAKKLIKSIKVPEHTNPHYDLRCVVKHVEYTKVLKDIKL